MGRPSEHPPEQRERSVRMVAELWSSSAVTAARALVLLALVLLALGP